MSSISNMPIVDQGVPMHGTTEYVWDHYQESVKMSTYLVAFVVSKFRFVETTRENNVRFRIWAEPNSLDQTAYARDIGPKILEFFESFFNVKFPLPKQDMIAIPDFGAGAMENWGLITYRSGQAHTLLQRVRIFQNYAFIFEDIGLDKAWIYTLKSLFK